jgi:hypothetical protein
VLHSSGLAQGPVAGSSEYCGNDYYQKFLHLLSDYQLLHDSALWIVVVRWNKMDEKSF